MKLSKYLLTEGKYPSGLDNIYQKDFDNEKPYVKKLIQKASDDGHTGIRLVRKGSITVWTTVEIIDNVIGKIAGKNKPLFGYKNGKWEYK